MANIFNSVKGLHPKRNAFSSDTYRNDFTAPLGLNIPVYIQEVPPATRVKLSASALVRLQALVAPVMDNIDYYVHFWQIPYRLLEDDRFTKFISGEIEAADYDGLFATPAQLSAAVLYQITAESLDERSTYNSIFGNGSLLDFLGYDSNLFPTLQVGEGGTYDFVGGNNQTVFNWRAVIAYFMLHEHWYMNENVPYFDDFASTLETLVKEQDLDSLAKLLVLTAKMFYDHSTDSASYSMLPHGWDKDYFTSALPNVQFGDPVTLNLGGTAPVNVPAQTVLINPIEKPTALSYIQATFDGELDQSYGVYAEPVIADSDKAKIQANGNNLTQLLGQLEGNTLDHSLVATADLSEATAITINELRFANALQVFKERQMRFGRRRLEYYKGFFDVVPEDLRLQVPKYLGGGRMPINIADIEQTSSTSGSSALGSLAGKGTGVAANFAGFKTFCSEETIIVGIAFAIPHITYAQQVSRFKLKTNDIYDYFNPSFEHLGEQAIKKIEIYAGSSDPDGDFGYTPRYAEYRFHSNEMHGAFKDSLAFWSLGRIFSSQPYLNSNFVYMQPAVLDRIFAVANKPNMVISMIFNVKSIKPVSKYGTPMLLA